jgi:hypothetical protein
MPWPSLMATWPAGLVCVASQNTRAPAGGLSLGGLLGPL